MGTLNGPTVIDMWHTKLDSNGQQATSVGGGGVGSCSCAPAVVTAASISTPDSPAAARALLALT